MGTRARHAPAHPDPVGKQTTHRKWSFRQSPEGSGCWGGQPQQVDSTGPFSSRLVPAATGRAAGQRDGQPQRFPRSRYASRGRNNRVAARTARLRCHCLKRNTSSPCRSQPQHIISGIGDRKSTKLEACGGWSVGAARVTDCDRSGLRMEWYLAGQASTPYLFISFSRKVGRCCVVCPH
jgi:hypothetical protein